jgi:hypothetical protein
MFWSPDAINPNGSRHETAQRFAFGAANGWVPLTGHWEIDHLCRVRNCVRPSHLEAVSAAENRRRARATKPPKRIRAKLARVLGVSSEELGL